MIRPISHFIDLRTIAAAHGLADARTFEPIEPPAQTRQLEEIADSAALAEVLDAAGHRLTVTAAMLRNHVTATNEEHRRRFASWLAVAHLRALTDPEYSITAGDAQ